MKQYLRMASLAGAVLLAGMSSQGRAALLVPGLDTLTDGGVTFTLDSCIGPCAAGEWDVLPGSDVGIIIKGIGGNPLLTAGQDLGLLFRATSAGTLIGGMVLSFVGTGDANVGEEVIDPPENLADLPVGLASYWVNVAGATEEQSFGPLLQVELDKDMYGGSNGTITSVTQRLLLVPEPTSLALLATGLGAVWLTRRRARRSQR